MDNIKIHGKGVWKLLKNIKQHKTTGPDSIPSVVLKLAAEEVAHIPTEIFQKSLDTGKIPQDWRDANVVPLFKKGERHIKSNYRHLHQSLAKSWNT